MPTKTALIVDDHPIVRTGVERLLAQDGFVRAVGSVGTIAEARAFLAREPVDLLILDLELPDAGNVDAVRDLSSRCPTTSIVVLSAHTEQHYATGSMEAGARAYVTKSSGSTTLLQAIRHVLSGSTYVSRDLDPIRPDGDGRGGRPHERLSTREFEVFCKLAAGRGIGDIATELGLSAKTVASHRLHVFAKMKLGSNADLMYYAIKHGLVA